MRNEIKKIVLKEDDLLELRKFLNELIQKRCWEVGFSYGDELELNIGKKVSYKNPFFKDKKKGEWILGTRGSDWELRLKNDLILSSHENIEFIKKKIKIIENILIANIKVEFKNFLLELSFDNDYIFRIIPNLEENDISYWELFTPYDMYLEAGPGQKWSFLKSN